MVLHTIDISNLESRQRLNSDKTRKKRGRTQDSTLPQTEQEPFSSVDLNEELETPSKYLHKTSLIPV